MVARKGYKLTEVGEIPEDWEVKLLRELGDALIGLTYSPNDVCEYGTLVLRASNIQNNSLSFEDNVYVKKNIPERIKARNGDLLICVRNGSRSLIGKSALLDERVDGMTFGAFMTVFRSSIGSMLSYLFQSEIIKRQISEYLGATINQITNASLKSFCIPLSPHSSEQIAIATALSDADALIEALEQSIAKKRQIKQGAMQELLTGKRRLPGFGGEWKEITLAHVGKCLRGVGYNPDSDLYSNATEDSIRLLRANNIKDDCILFSTIQHVDKRCVSEKQILRDGDLLICMANGSKALVGKSAVFYCKDEYKYTFGAFMACFRAYGNIESKKIFRYLFQTIEYKQHLDILLAGTSIKNLAPSSIECFAITIPANPKEQTAIANILSDMDDEIAALEAKLAKARQIKIGMMQELLTGRIRLV